MTAVYGHRPSQRLVQRFTPDRSTPNLFNLPDPGDSIEARFQAAHAAHPEVAVELVKRTYLALEDLDAGKRVKPPTMKELWEELRGEGWSLADGSPFALDNCYTALFARLIMDENPDLRGVFRLRPRTSK